MGMGTSIGKSIHCFLTVFVILLFYSQDLLAICRELSLEDSLDELMLQLGADSQGRISYEQFLQRRLALRPEIDALKSSNKDNISDNSQGKQIFI